MRIPSYLKHSSGTARVSINGRDYLLGPFNSKESKAKYKRLVGEWIASQASCSFGIPADQLTVSQLLKENRVTPLSCGNSAGTNRKSNPHRVPGHSYTTGSYGQNRMGAQSPEHASGPFRHLPNWRMQRWGLGSQ